MTASLEDLADTNLAHATRIHTRWQKRSRLEEVGGVQLHRGSLRLPLPFQNAVLRIDRATRGGALLEHTEAFFGSGDTRFAVLVQSHSDADLATYLDDRGFHLQSDVPTMLVAAPVECPSVGDRFRIVEATRPEQAEAFVRVSALAYESLGLPARMTPAYFARTETLLADDVSLVLATTEDDEAVAAAMVLHTGAVAGIYWVGTLPEARGARLAAACTAIATNLGFARGARGVTLQASPMGEPTYRKLGYREYGRLRRFCR